MDWPQILRPGVSVYVIKALKPPAKRKRRIASLGPDLGTPARPPKQLRPKRKVEVMKLWTNDVWQRPAAMGMQPKKMPATDAPALEIKHRVKLNVTSGSRVQ